MAEIIAAFGVLVTGIVALSSFIYSSHRNRVMERQRMYQYLELTSIDFFKWETGHRKQMAEARKEAMTKGTNNISPENMSLLIGYYTQALNLFELCIYNAINRTIPPEVFSTWLPWIFEVAHEDTFAEIWNTTLRFHYLEELGTVLKRAMSSNNLTGFVTQIYDKKRTYHLKPKGLENRDWDNYNIIKDVRDIEYGKH